MKAISRLSVIRYMTDTDQDLQDQTIEIVEDQQKDFPSDCQVDANPPLINFLNMLSRHKAWTNTKILFVFAVSLITLVIFWQQQVDKQIKSPIPIKRRVLAFVGVVWLILMVKHCQHSAFKICKISFIIIIWCVWSKCIKI